jgi:hypothetical protein
MIFHYTEWRSIIENVPGSLKTRRLSRVNNPCISLLYVVFAVWSFLNDVTV